MHLSDVKDLVLPVLDHAEWPGVAVIALILCAWLVGLFVSTRDTKGKERANIIRAYGEAQPIKIHMKRRKAKKDKHELDEQNRKAQRH